ncbi:MAG: hypothetical protein RL477_2276, partial [Pseudomonadota bacterium]
MRRRSWRGRARGWALLCLTSAVPGVAEAQGFTASRELMLAALVAVPAVVIAILIATFAVRRSRRRAAAGHRRVRELFAGLARITAVLDAKPAGFFEWSAASGLESCSPGLAQVLGVSPVAVKSFHDLRAHFVAEDFQALQARADALRNHRTEFHQLVRTTNGRVLEAAGRLIVSVGTGEAIAYTVWFHDTTQLSSTLRDSLAAAEIAEAQRDQLHEMLDAAPFPIWRRGPDLNLRWVNRAYAAAVEADPLSAVEQGIEFASGSQQPHALAALARESGAPQSDTRRFNIGGERRV